MTIRHPLAWSTLCALAAQASAQLDGNVQWARLSHAPESDRRPLCPLNGQAFDVLFQTARYDLTGARVAIDDGADGTIDAHADAEWDSNSGPYDLWRASLPATSRGRVAYFIELIDGEDRDYLSAAGVSDEPPTGGLWTLDFDTLEHAPLGSTPTEFGTVFRVWAPNAQEAYVRGTFNGWSLSNPMTRRGPYYTAVVPQAGVGGQYKYFFVRGEGAQRTESWRSDPRARRLNGLDGSYNAVIYDTLAYQWRHPAFSPVPAEQWVVYQLHVGTFAGLNDPAGPTPAQSRYSDVEARAAHLVELGVNAVQINPINEFPGAQSGGYNSASMFAFESTYGTPDRLKSMIDTLHGHGIAVVLDMVWNHVSSSDNQLWNFDGTQIYFDTPNVNTPWGPQLDIDRPEVFAYYLDSVETVLGEYRVDGYRHDAIYELVSAAQYAPGQALVRAMMGRARARFEDTHIYGEIYNNSAWNTSPGGIDLNGQYHEAYKNAIYAAVEAASFGDPDMGRLAASIDGSGPWVEGDRVFNYYELHDEAWPLSGAGRTRAVRRIDTTPPHDDRYALGRTKLANALTILAQGVPAILMGTEWAEDNGWEVAKIDWSHKDTYRGVFNFYRDLIGLRTTRRALFANSPANVFHVNDGANVIAFERTGWDGRSYVALANFSNTAFSEYIVGLPRPGPWGVVLNSEESKYQGIGLGTPAGPIAVQNEGRDGLPHSARLALPPHGLLLLQHQPEYVVDPTAIDRNIDGAVNAQDLGVLVRGLAQGFRETDFNQDLARDVFDVIDYARALADR